MSNAYISYTQTSLKQSKEIFVAKNIFFLLICLHLHLIDRIREQTFVSFSCFILLTLNVFLIFDFKHVVRDVGRTFVMEHVFCMDRYFKAQLCLWAPPCPINLRQFWYSNSGLAWTPESTHLLLEKLCSPLNNLNDWWRCI